MMKKEETIITLSNGGMHSQRAYVRMKAMLNNNKYICPRLYQIVLCGNPDLKEYQSALGALCLRLTRENIPHSWKSCVEVDKNNILFKRIFILTEAKYKNPSSILNHHKQGWLTVMLSYRDIKFAIVPPKNPIHRTKQGKQLSYATLAGQKLDDCLLWISYLVRNKCKPDLEHIYYGSRDKKKELV
jgi:hypothetical protein